MKPEKIFKIITYLSFAGIFLAVYLIWQQNFRPAFQPCNINSTVNCEAIVSGPVSETLGISTPLIGLAGYIMILIGSIIKNKKLVLSMSAFGLVFCLYIAYIELFKLHVICPVCIMCQILMISVFALSIVLHKTQSKL
jgi:uncharacterized membrane protein